MNVRHIKHDISYHLEENRLILYIDITNYGGEESKFYFSNNTGGQEWDKTF